MISETVMTERLFQPAPPRNGADTLETYLRANLALQAFISTTLQEVRVIIFDDGTELGKAVIARDVALLFPEDETVTTDAVYDAVRVLQAKAAAIAD